MKYKNISAAIHNFGHSFTSLVNYVEDGYVIDELSNIHAKGHEIQINWLNGQFQPSVLASPRITKSIEYWRASLAEHLQRHNIAPAAIAELRFVWPTPGRKYMAAVDDRGKSYKVYVNETK